MSIFSETDLVSLTTYLGEHGVLTPKESGLGPRIHNTSEDDLHKFSTMIFSLLPSLKPSLCKFPISSPNNILMEIRKYHLELEIDPEITAHYTYRIIANLLKYNEQGRSRIASRRVVHEKHKEIHDQLMSIQNHRCQTCGLEFNEDNIPDLDHVIPYAIGGDVNDGSNWQYLCSDCNSGKSTVLTMNQHRYSGGWVYGLPGYIPERQKPHAFDRIRYFVLRRDRECVHCSKTPQQVNLQVSKKLESGLKVPSNLHCICIDCKSNG